MNWALALSEVSLPPSFGPKSCKLCCLSSSFWNSPLALLLESHSFRNGISFCSSGTKACSKPAGDICHFLGCSPVPSSPEAVSPHSCPILKLPDADCLTPTENQWSDLTSPSTPMPGQHGTLPTHYPLVATLRLLATYVALPGWSTSCFLRLAAARLCLSSLLSRVAALLQGGNRWGIRCLQEDQSSCQ